MSDSSQDKDFIEKNEKSDGANHQNSEYSQKNALLNSILVDKDEALLRLIKFEALNAFNYNLITTSPVVNQALEQAYLENLKTREEILNETSIRKIDDLCFKKFLLYRNKNIFEGDPELSPVFTLEFLTLEERYSPRYKDLRDFDKINFSLSIPPRKEPQRAKVNLVHSHLNSPTFNAHNAKSIFKDAYDEYETNIMNIILKNPSASKEDIINIIKNTKFGNIFHASNSEIEKMTSNSQWRNNPNFKEKQQEIIKNLTQIGCFSFGPKLEAAETDISFDEAIIVQNNFQKSIINATEKIGIKPLAFGHNNSINLTYSKDKESLGAFLHYLKILNLNLYTLLDTEEKNPHSHGNRFSEKRVKTIIHEWLHSLDNLVIYKIAEEQEKLGITPAFNISIGNNNPNKNRIYLATQYLNADIGLPKYNNANQAYEALNLIYKQLSVDNQSSTLIKWEINKFVKKSTSTFVKDILGINKEQLSQQQQQFFKTNHFENTISLLLAPNEKSADILNETLNAIKQQNIKIDNNTILAKYNLFINFMQKELDNNKITINKESQNKITNESLTDLTNKQNTNKKNIDFETNPNQDNNTKINLDDYIQEYPNLSKDNIQQVFNIFQEFKKTKKQILDLHKPTEFVKNGLNLDKLDNKKPYYQTPQELFARYGESNLYLVQYKKYLGLFNVKSKDWSTYDDRYTTPTFKEQIQFNIALQHCISKVLGVEALRDDTTVAKNINAYDEMLEKNNKQLKTSVFAIKSSKLIRSCATTIINTTIETNKKISNNLSSYNENFKDLIDNIVNNLIPQNQNNAHNKPLSLNENIGISYQNLETLDKSNISDNLDKNTPTIKNIANTIKKSDKPSDFKL